MNGHSTPRRVSPSDIMDVLMEIKSTLKRLESKMGDTAGIPLVKEENQEYIVSYCVNVRDYKVLLIIFSYLG